MMTVRSKIRKQLGEEETDTKKKRKKKVEKVEANPCSKCPMNGKKKVIEPVNKTASILLVGEAPGEEEEIEGRGFVGKSGQYLRRVLVKAGFNIERDIQFTNVCHCRPTDESGKNRTPVSKEIKICTPQYLQHEIEKFDNIILVGKIPEQAVLGDAKSSLRGNVLLFKGKRIAVTWHPSYMTRLEHIDPTAKGSYEDDFKFFRSVFIDGYAPKYMVVDTTDETATNICFEDVLASKEISFDIETNGLGLDAVINTVGIATDKMAYVIPIVGKYSHNKDLVKRIFDFMDKVYIGFNVQFDYNLLLVNGLCNRKIVLKDVMILEHTLESSKARGEFRLKAVAVDSGFRWSRLLLNPADPEKFEDLFPYNAEDVIITRNLWKMKRIESKEKKMIPVQDKVIFPVINVISEMELTGMLINLEEMKRVRKRLVQKSEILEMELHDQFGERNWGSTKQLQELFESLLAGNTRKTAGGSISTDEESLRIYLSGAAEGDPLKNLCEQLLALRETKKMLNTYIDGLSEKIYPDGRIRGHFSLVGTVTGRLSSSSPNLQNIPREGLIKRMFVAPEGWTFVESDASQVELRVVASIAPEPRMIKAYNEKIDLHTLTASIVSGVSLDKVTKVQRQTAKAVNFGLIYGQSWQGFKAYAKMTFGVILTDEEAQRFRQTFFERYSGIQQWHKEVTRAVEDGQTHTVTVFGRTRLLEGDNLGFRTRQAMNTPVQSPASDCNLIAMRYVWDNVDFDRCKFVVTVHDSFMLVVRDDYLEEVFPIIQKSAAYVTERCSWLRVPFVLDMKTGKNWGEMVELKKE